jgi:hypothetical protein
VTLFAQGFDRDAGHGAIETVRFGMGVDDQDIHGFPGVLV